MYIHFFLFPVTIEIFMIYCLTMQWLPNWPPSSMPSSPDTLPSKQYFQNVNVMFLMVKSFTRCPSRSPNSLVYYDVHSCLCMLLCLCLLHLPIGILNSGHIKPFTVLQEHCAFDYVPSH